MRIAHQNLSLILLLGVLSACGGAQSRLASHMSRGQQYFADGNFAKANVEFRNAMQLAPKSSAARIMAARTAESLARPRDAVGLYQSVLELDPDNLEARTQLARLYVLGGAANQALGILAPGLAKHPGDAALLTVRAGAEAQLNELTQAQTDVDRALRLAPTHEDAVALRAGLYRKANDAADAIALLESTLRRIPSSVGLRQVLADVYAESGEQEKAADQVRALIRLVPTELRYRYVLASLEERTRHPDAAQRVLEEAVRAFPDSDSPKLALVSLLTRAHGREAGERVLRGYIAQQPKDLDLPLELGALLQSTGAMVDARAEYQEVIRRDGTGPKALAAMDRLAALDFAHANFDAARQQLTAVLKVNPGDNDALALRAQIALIKGDSASAVGDLRVVLRDHPRSAGLQQLLARAYLQQGDPDLALQAMQSALDANPADDAVRIEVALLMIRTQKADQAVKLLQDSAQRAPDNVPLQDTLIRAYLNVHDFGDARTAAEALQTRRPNLADGFYLAGLASQGQHRWDDAGTAFERALRLHPGDFQVLSALAEMQAATGHRAQALALLRNETTRDPKDAAALDLLGQLYLADRQPALAVQALNAAVSVAPHWWLAARNLAVAKLAMHDFDGAIAAYRLAIKAAPAEATLVNELATLYVSHGRSEAAIGAFEDWHRRNPQVQLVARNLAMLLVTYRRDRASLDEARDLTEAFSSSTDGHLLDTNGWVHFKREEYAAAVPILQRATERAPEAREIRYHLGMAELRTGQKDRARRDLTSAVSGSARFAGVDEARATLASLNSGTG
ncbi:MAG TPA: tetratricopeptide repeat protein [Steroidobacteraceae bacterium]|nr:tetratricopeptide repeat protein [Steroidobacteraceae bacterium]